MRLRFERRVVAGVIGRRGKAFSSDYAEILRCAQDDRFKKAGMTELARRMTGIGGMSRMDDARAGKDRNRGETAAFRVG
jgi:hypothetical protein